MHEMHAADGGHRDIHESDTAYMEHCRTAALYAAEKCGWTVISCALGGEELSPDEVYTAIVKALQM